MRLAPLAALLLAGTAVLPAAGPAQAQSAQQGAAQLGGRVDRLEREMRAVQRKVFPGANPDYFDPEIAPAQAPQPSAGQPASTPVADLQARVRALETELSRLTGQVEQNGYRVRQLEEQMGRFRTETADRLKAIEAAGAPPAAPAEGAPAPIAAAPTPPPAPAKIDAAKPAPAKPIAAKPAPAKPAPAAPAEAAAPSSGDPGEDAYMAGYRLWVDKKYDEAATALKAVVAKYPKHKRASYAQNLLGRAYLDGGKPAMAAEVFYANYQKMPRGERAPDSLYYLGQALLQLKKPEGACKVYDELQDVYGATIAEPLKGRVAQGRKDAKCS
ncbi:hypothetical protein CLG96_01000 [Sphingomonas oleivorans]|uniref:YbgF trimerisation domain-containing protein n=2 Tax=Sphingomonas oleivorans TaxID=1735121 RepID=A0A2T5G302_9SPHN|nr:tetratricopeptide repeat protein [Sphingomonas oleivorans]PTQ13528.1 hypothetical protein CLG96_01000 [Sphingomonas oleivorans]